MIKDETRNRKQSSISILNTSIANRSVDSNAHSTNSYLNQLKMNNCSNSFSTLSLNFHTKGMNRTDIMSYTLKRPELDIEELYDKEMENYFSNAKKEDFKISNLDTETNLNSEKTNNTTNYIKMLTFGKEPNNNLNNNNISTNTSNSTLQNMVNKVNNIKSVSQNSKSLSKSVAPVPQQKETPKKNEVKHTAAATTNIKKVTTNTPIPKKGVEIKTNNSINTLNLQSITTNIAPTPKRETFASVEKNKNNLSVNDNSAKSKASESLLNSVKKVNNIIKTVSAVASSGNNNPSDRLDKNSKLNFNTKETARTSSVVKTTDKNFRTKADEAVKKFASIDKKINKK
jgi:hypothetical protein